MKRIKEEFLDRLERHVRLKNLSVLEIGCGDGTRSIAIARRCKEFTGIEPDRSLVEQAAKRKIPNARFKVGFGEKIPLDDNSYDVAIFALSLHHIPIAKMGTAIDEAARVVRRLGYVVFLEAGEKGSFFEAELRFDAGDGDERKEKRAAYAAILNCRNLRSIAEINDETAFQFESAEDFIKNVKPTKNLHEIEAFLQAHHFILRAQRRINIFQCP